METGTTGRAEYQRGNVCAFPERWQEVQDDRKYFREQLADIKALLTKLSSDHDEHVKKLYTGNSHPAVIPTINQRITTLEQTVLPRDDVRDVVVAFKVGKAILITVAGVAALGFLGILFWHLFHATGPTGPNTGGKA